MAKTPDPIAAMMRQARQNRGWSLTTAAEHTGIAAVVLGSWERGDRHPALPNLHRWVEAFGYQLTLVPTEKETASTARWARLDVAARRGATAAARGALKTNYETAAREQLGDDAGPDEVQDLVGRLRRADMSKAARASAKARRARARERRAGEEARKRARGGSMPDRTVRPEPYEAPDGYVYVAVPAGPEWRIETGRRCRAGATQFRPACGAPSVAALLRGRLRTTGMWWAYCADHLCGRWREDGQVMQWVLRPEEEVESGA